MRVLGLLVDCAANISEARSWWRADLYDLVLINMENDLGHRDKFCADIRGATPPQQLAFLVGKPEYLADSPNAEGSPPGPTDASHALPEAGATALPGSIPTGLPQRWGIMETSRRISVVRSASAARSRAMQERPAPPRDLESRHLKRATAEAQLLAKLQREDTQ
jgi:hypothetical protein